MPALSQQQRRIAAVRNFNRFYTRQIGVLRKNFLDSPYTLGEARVLYEIGPRRLATASDIGRALGLDAGYLSRVLRNFEKNGLVARTASADDGRRSYLALTVRGQKIMASLDARSQRDVSGMLGKLGPADQARLMAAMNTIETLLGADREEARQSEYILRAPRPGDFGWVVKRHAELYAQEYQWKEPFEGVCAQIVADFVNTFDAKRERCWITEMNGENVGCVFVAKETPDVARIRLLLVDPKARGLGLGARLTDECIKFARSAGYSKMTLWTHSVLTAARHIYQKAGFKLMRCEQHHHWGPRVVSEHWDLEL
jgi:DNA-binding MarR family transcriptional regulator/N-acetylglutamate synthase-like GNAT family acetyltransferase